MRTTNKRDQLQEVLNAFNIEVKEGSLLSRCAKCNGTFIPRCRPFVSAVTVCLLFKTPICWVSLGENFCRNIQHLVHLTFAISMMLYLECQGCDLCVTEDKAAEMAQALDEGSASSHMHPVRGR